MSSPKNQDPYQDLEAWHFGGKGSGIEDSLAKLVLEGKKTATSGWLLAYEKEGEPLPVAGERSIILDSQDQRVCVVELVEVTQRAFFEVDAEFAAQEGEGDLSLDYWRRAHDSFFSGYAKELGIEWDPKQATLVCERFRVAHVFPGAELRLGAGSDE